MQARAQWRMPYPHRFFRAVARRARIDAAATDQLPVSPQRADLTKDEWLGALGICLLVFLSTFPVVIPFLFMDDVRAALRVSNAVAIMMLFMCGYAFARNTGLRPWPTGLVMVAIGAILVGIAIALGG